MEYVAQGRTAHPFAYEWMMMVMLGFNGSRVPTQAMLEILYFCLYAHQWVAFWLVLNIAKKNE